MVTECSYRSHADTDKTGIDKTGVVELTPCSHLNSCRYSKILEMSSLKSLMVEGWIVLM